MIESIDTIVDDIASEGRNGNIHSTEEVELPWGFIDRHGYLQKKCGKPRISVNRGNSRPLGPECRVIAELLGEEPSLGHEWLESGPGAGVAVAQLSDVALKNNEKIQVDTISLTALAPHVRPHRNLAVGTDDWENTCQPKLSDQEKWAILKKRFSKIDARYLRHQYIGNFPDGIKPPENTYSVFAESYGAIRYAENKPLALRCGLDSLRSNGVMMVHASMLHMRQYIDDILTARKHCSAIVQNNPHYLDEISHTLIANPDHPISRQERNGSERLRTVSSLLEYLLSFVGKSIHTLLAEDAHRTGFGPLCITKYGRYGYKVVPWAPLQMRRRIDP